MRLRSAVWALRPARRCFSLRPVPRSRSRVVERLPCQPSLFSTALTPLPLIVRATIAVGRSWRALPRTRGRSRRRRARRSRSRPSRTPRRGAYDARSQPCIVSPRWPSRLMSRIAIRLSSPAKAACSNASHIDPSASSLSPHRHQTRYGSRSSFARERDADRDRQALAERAGRDVDPRDLRRRVSLEPRAELAERQELLVGDRTRGLEHRIEERRRVALSRRSGGRCAGRPACRSRSAGTWRAERPSGRRPTSRTSGGPTWARLRSGWNRRGAAVPAPASARRRSWG